jgi:hypothetical protein
MKTDVTSTFASVDVGERYVFRPRASARTLMMRDRSWTHAFNILHDSPSWIGDAGILAVVTRVTRTAYTGYIMTKVELLAVNAPAGTDTCIDVYFQDTAKPYVSCGFSVYYTAAPRRVDGLSLCADLFDIARCADLCAAIKRGWTHRAERMRMKAVLSRATGDCVAASLARMMFPVIVV